MNKVETWLPVFPGFYGTRFEPEEDDEIYSINQERELLNLNPVKWDQMNWNYEDYMDNVVKHATDFIEGKLQKLNMVSEIKLQRLISPKYYNYSNDAVDIEVKLSKDNIKNIKKYLIKNSEEFEWYIEEHYTSCSGFISFYSNDIIEWLYDLKSVLKHSHQLGAVLNFICELEEVDTEQMLEYCQQNGCYIYCSNYEDCTTKMYNFKEQCFI